MEIKDFAEIEQDFLDRVNSMIWCSVATVDSHNRPRSRILHPIWERANGQPAPTGWIGTHRASFKDKHLTHNPYVSLAYITDVMKPVYVDCLTEWVDDLQQKQRIWDLFKNTPPPLGYDPAIDFIRPDHENFGLLKLLPWRIALVTFPAPSHYEGQRIWRSHR